MVVKMVVRLIANLSEEAPLPRMPSPRASMLRRRAPNQSWQQTSCRDVVRRRYIQGASGLDHLQAGRGLTMPQKWPRAIGPTEGRGPP
jgi:hypothetical protein